MAGFVGRKLLNEVVEAGMEEILSSLRALEGRKEYFVPQLSPLDRVFAINYARQQPNQTTSSRIPVLEICSDNSGAGKTQLTYLMITLAILPDVHGSTILGGNQGAVVYFDTDGCFDILRLSQIMASYIQCRASQDTPIEDTDTLITRSLQHVHVFQPQNMKSLLHTLSQLKTYFLDPAFHNSHHRAIHSVILDNANAFSHQVRADLEDQRLAALDTINPRAHATTPQAPDLNPYALLVSQLRSFQRSFNCAVITTSELSYSDNGPGGTRTSRTLPAPWPGYPTIKLVVKREEVRKFAPGISWEEATKDKGLRQEEVEKGRYIASSQDGREWFKFAITKDGIHLIDNVDGDRNERV